MVVISSDLVCIPGYLRYELFIVLILYCYGIKKTTCPQELSIKYVTLNLTFLNFLPFPLSHNYHKSRNKVMVVTKIGYELTGQGDHGINNGSFVISSLMHVSVHAHRATHCYSP